MNRLNKQSGIAHVGLILLVAIVLGVVGFAGWKVSQKKNNSNGKVSSSAVCPSPLLQTPTDVSLVTAILYPGQYRGGNYKPHGGFRFDNASNEVQVKAPLDAKLIDGARYFEQGEQQILLDFKSGCGVNYRFDHLLTLAPKIQAAIDKLPAPQEENSMTHDIGPVDVKTGEAIATAVGFTKSHNVSFDFGVYDYRQPNAASKDPQFIAAHKSDPGQDMLNHGVCWFDYLPAADAAKLKDLPGGDQASGKNSDYCK